MATIKGKILSIGEVRTWTSRDGSKSGANSSVVIEYPSYNNSFYKVVFQITERLIDLVNQLGVGAEVTVSYSIYAREWNGKLYNNVEAYKIEPSASAEPAEPAEPATDGNNGFSQEDFNAKDGDLPF